MLAGSVGFIVTGVWMLLRMLKVHPLWGLLALLWVPQLLFVVMHWEQAREPFVGTLFCGLLIALRMPLAGLGGG